MAEESFACEVLEVGTQADSGKIAIKLLEVGGRGGWKEWCYAADSMRREILATGLTALSIRARVAVFMNMDDKVIKRINVLRP